MTVKKFAISVPEDVMVQVDAAAKRRGLTRSGFISLVLRRLASARRDAEITRRLNEVLVDPETHDELTRSARHLLAARKDEGWEW